MLLLLLFPSFFFFNDTATTEIYTLSLHDALPIYVEVAWIVSPPDRNKLDGIHHVGVRHSYDAKRGFFNINTERFGHMVNRSEEHTSELQSQSNLVCRLLLEKKKKKK